MERNKSPALWRKPPAHRYSPFLSLPRQRPTLQRRNVREHLPESCRAEYDRRLQNAYALADYAEAKAALQRIWRQLCEVNPSTARSLEEGMEETSRCTGWA